MPINISNHYNDSYFRWQASIGEFGGWANLIKFSEHISETDVVLDFGCGGGYLLKNIRCRKKVGVEINNKAAKNAEHFGIEVYENVESVADNYIDVIISNNTLEHTLNPFQELKALYPKLRKGGKLILVVPCESISYAYQPNNVNRHLYSWSPMCLGNLIIEAGFTLIESKAYFHKWPPNYRLIAKFGGRRLFEIACKIYGRIERSWFQTRAIAIKENS